MPPARSPGRHIGRLHSVSPDAERGSASRAGSRRAFHKQQLDAGGTLRLDVRGISWGGFMRGFDLQLTNSNGTTGCGRLACANGGFHGPAAVTMR